jgi:hypothetical protein
MSNHRRIERQIELTEELKSFLSSLQTRLTEATEMYDRSLQKMESEGLFMELLEKQRKEHFSQTKKNIEDLIELIEYSDKPLCDEIVDFLYDLMNT